MNTTLSYALDDILTYKLDIKAAINAKGGDAGDTLSYYATAISNLPTSSQRSQWPDGLTCKNSAPSVDWSQYDTSNVTNMAEMFSGCDTSNMTNLSYFDTSSATNMSRMFNEISINGCINEYDEQTGDLISSYLPFDLSSFNTSNVTDMEYMFCNCSGLTYLDLSSFNTSNVTNMDSMFINCSRLTQLDVSSFNTSNVTNMYSMFSDCSRLTQLDVSSFNTSNVTDMNSMFANCNSLTHLDLSSFNTSNVLNMAAMFFNNPYLTYINVSSFNTSNVTSMSEMFHCHRLSYIDVSSFDYTNVQTIQNMFYDSTATLINLSNANFATDGSCDTSQMFYVDWYDEDTQTQHSWSNITRTVVLDNVSNDVFNYLTQNTCPASEYGADYYTNSCSIAPNWIIHRDGDTYIYDSTQRAWVNVLNSPLNISGPLTPEVSGNYTDIVYAAESNDVYLRSAGFEYDSSNDNYYIPSNTQHTELCFDAPSTHRFETITFVNLDATYKAVVMQIGTIGNGVISEDGDGNTVWTRNVDYNPTIDSTLPMDFTQMIQQVGATMTCDSIVITLSEYNAQPEPEPTSPRFTSPAHGDLITGTIGPGTPAITYPIELEYGDGTPIPYDITSQHVTCDNIDILIGQDDVYEDGQSHITSVYMSINQGIGVGDATLTYEDPDTGDTCTVTFSFDITEEALDVLMMTGNETEWQSDDSSITDNIEATDPYQDDPETGEPPLHVTDDCTFSCDDSNITINGNEITASAPGKYEIIAQDNNTGRTGSVIWTITEAQPEPQQSVILTSANIRTANGTSEKVAVARYPYNNVNPINTIDENLKMSLKGDPAIVCNNLANSNIVLQAWRGFTLESSVDQIAQVIITLNADHDNDTSHLDVQPNEDNQLVFAEVHEMSFSFIAGSTSLHFTQIEVIYD